MRRRRLGRMLRLYLDPFLFFKNTSIGTPAAQAEALQYNRRHRQILLTYVRRWTVIGLACLAGSFPLAAAARTNPIFYVPIAGLELGFSTALCMLLFAIAVYFVLGLERL